MKKKEEEKKLRAAIGYASCSARLVGEVPAEKSAEESAEEQNEPNGDTVCSCWLPDGSQAVILSDGMGHGAAAAAESRAAAGRLRQLLKQGMPAARAIREVNRMLLQRADGEEMYATVDLLILDQPAGRARFYKLGAAPSYIIRGLRIRTVRQEALPVGILPRLKLTHISARLSAGDIIVMMSDGITDSGRRGSLSEAEWVTSYLSDILKNGGGRNRKKTCRGPRQIAGLLLEEARNRDRGQEMDDATVAVIQIR